MAEVDNGMDTMQAGTGENNLLDSDVGFPLKRDTDPMSQSMYDASTSDPMSQSMYGYDNGLIDAGSDSTPIPAQFDSLCSNGDAQYPGYKDQGLLNGGGSDAGPVPEGVLIDFGGQNQNPFEAPILQPEPKLQPEPVPHPEPLSHPEPVPQPEPVVHTEPVPQPKTVLHSELVPQSKSVTKPETVTQPKPVSEPEPVPQSKSVTKPEPVPQPKPVSKPEPVPQTKPVTKPEPEPQPKPVTKPEPEPQPKPVTKPEPVSPPKSVPHPEPVPQAKQTESKLMSEESGKSQLSEPKAKRPTTVDDLITTELPAVSLDRQLNEGKSENFGEVSVLKQTRATESVGDKMEGGGDLMQGGTVQGEGTQPVNGDIVNSGYTEITQSSSTVTETTTVNGEVTKETTKARQESRIPQKPPSPRKSGMPVRSPKKETAVFDVGPGWDDSITVPHPRPPVSAHLLPRNMKEPTPPPRPLSARSSVERKKYGIDSKRPDYKPGGGDVRIFSEKKEYKAEKRIDSRASPAPRGSPKPSTPRTPPVSTPSPNLTGVKSKIGSMDKASHTPGGGNVRIVTKKSDFSTVGSRVGSKDKIQHKPGGGNVKIENKKLALDNVGSRIGSMDNAQHKAGGGDKKIETKSLNWEVKSRVGSMDNAKHVAGGGDKKIESHKVDWKVESKVGSLDNAQHIPGGGDKKILDEKVEVKAESKVGSLKNVKHAPGGGDKVIETQKLNFRETAKARTKHGVNDEDGSGRSNSVTSQSTAEGSQ